MRREITKERLKTSALSIVKTKELLQFFDTAAVGVSFIADNVVSALNGVDVRVTYEVYGHCLIEDIINLLPYDKLIIIDFLHRYREHEDSCIAYNANLILSLIDKYVFEQEEFINNIQLLPEIPSVLDLFSPLESLTDEEKEARAVESEKAEEIITKAVTVKPKYSEPALDLSGLPVLADDIYPLCTIDKEGNLLPEFVEIGIESKISIERVRAMNYIVKKRSHRIMFRHELLAIKGKVIEPEKILLPIYKCMAGASVLTDIIISKVVSHLTFRQIAKKFKEGGSPLKISSTILYDWYLQTVKKLKSIYDLIREKVMASGYVQIRERFFRVLNGQKCDLGYMWVVRNAITGQIYLIFEKNVSFESFCTINRQAA